MGKESNAYREDIEKIEFTTKHEPVLVRHFQPINQEFGKRSVLPLVISIISLLSVLAAILYTYL
jgi:hypothetical protein